MRAETLPVLEVASLHRVQPAGSTTPAPSARVAPGRRGLRLGDALAGVGLLAAGLAVAIPELVPGAVLAVGLLTIVVQLARRAGIRRRRSLARRRVLVLGTGPLALRVLQSISASDTPYAVVGFVDTAGAPPLCPAIAPYVVGTLDTFEATLMGDTIDEVFVALPVKSHYREIQHALSVCERIGVSAKYRTDFFQTAVAWPRQEPGADPIVRMQVTQDDYRLVIKRVIDVVVTLGLLAALAPLLALAAIAIRATSRGPVLYAQDRYGLNRRRFRMLKFRTMVADAEAQQASLERLNEADGPVFKITRDPRITAVGRVLRRTSLDELPQLINVLRGEMSLVGPRPLPQRDVARFTDPADMRRFSVRPGLTCLWQISGRSTLSFADWMRLDLHYIDTWSLRLDFLILARTVPAVWRGTGAF